MSLLAALDRRAADAATADAASHSDSVLTLLVGPGQEPIPLPVDRVPTGDSLLGSMLRQRGKMDHACELPTSSPAFVRLLCEFLRDTSRGLPTAFSDYKVTFSTFVASFSPGFIEEGLSAEDRAMALRKVYGANMAEDDNNRLMRNLRRADEEHWLQHSRIQLILRGAYLEVPPDRLCSPPAADADGAPDHFTGRPPPRPTAAPPLRRQATEWGAVTRVPTIVNELRARAVEFWDVQAFHQPDFDHNVGLVQVAQDFRWVASDDGEQVMQTNPSLRAVGDGRLLPACVLWGRRPDGQWQRICASGRSVGAFESRVFALSNAPRRARPSAEFEARLLSLDEATLWQQLDFFGEDDLTFALARTLVATTSKLKNFLTAWPKPQPPAAGLEATAAVASLPNVGRPAAEDRGDWWQRRREEEEEEAKVADEGESRRLKQWPGKDAVQALAVWWMAALLVEGHRYTEPELYAIISSCCAMQPDHAVMRKEMVRRGFLEPPHIVQNDDATTTTYYALCRGAMLAALRGEWRSKGVF